MAKLEEIVISLNFHLQIRAIATYSTEFIDMNLEHLSTFQTETFS